MSNRGCDERLICVMGYFPAFGIPAVAVAAHQLKFLLSSCVESVLYITP
jgi:hypothetical protein